MHRMFRWRCLCKAWYTRWREVVPQKKNRRCCIDILNSKQIVQSLLGSRDNGQRDPSRLTITDGNSTVPVAELIATVDT
jgi:hypothetical protein